MTTKARSRTVVPAGDLVAQARQHAGADLDRLAAASARLTALVKAEGIPSTTPAVIDALATSLAEDAVNDAIRPDHADEIAQALREHQGQLDRSRVLGQAQSIVRTRMTEAIHRVADAGLQWLHTYLTELLTHSADTIVDQYRELRYAQRVLTTDARGRAADIRELHCAGTTRTPSDESYQAAIGMIVPRLGMGMKPTGYTPDPWPSPVFDGSDPIPSADPVAYLTWLIERGDAWVPTASELDQALLSRSRAMAVGLPIEDAEGEIEKNTPQRGKATVSFGPSGSWAGDLRRDLARRRGAQWP